MAYQTRAEGRMKGLSTDTAFNFELGQVLKNSLLAKSIIGRRARNGAIGLVTESRNFCSTQDKISVNRPHPEAKHPPANRDIAHFHLHSSLERCLSLEPTVSPRVKL